MDNQNMPPQGSPSSTPQPMMNQPGPEKSVGALIGSIIIVIILIIGGLYLWSTKITPVMEPDMMEKGMPAMINGATEEKATTDQALNQPDPVVSQMATVGTSDDTASIDNDLKATKLDGMGSELQ